MKRKDKIAELEKLQQAAAELDAEIAKIPHHICKYCGADFQAEDKRRRYCCPEHYLAENRERTRERNAQRVSKKN